MAPGRQLGAGGPWGRAPATSLTYVVDVPLPVGFPRQKIRLFRYIRCNAPALVDALPTTQ